MEHGGYTARSGWTSEDVDTAKPQPGIVHVALDRAGADTDRVVLVGDAVWDMKVSQEELQTAGAHAVFDNALDLCKRLDTSPMVPAETVSAHWPCASGQ